MIFSIQLIMFTTSNPQKKTKTFRRKVIKTDETSSKSSNTRIFHYNEPVCSSIILKFVKCFKIFQAFERN